MNVSLSSQSEAIARRLLGRGYDDPAAIVEQALQRMNAEADSLEQLQAELIIGEQSGDAIPFELAKIQAQVAENIRLA